MVGINHSNRHVLLLHERYVPGGESGEALSHSAHEAGVVIKGKIELTVGEETQVLNTGDGSYFESRLPHHRTSDLVISSVLFDGCYPLIFPNIRHHWCSKNGGGSRSHSACFFSNAHWSCRSYATFITRVSKLLVIAPCSLNYSGRARLNRQSPGMVNVGKRRQETIPSAGKYRLVGSCKGFS